MKKKTKWKNLRIVFLTVFVAIVFTFSFYQFSNKASAQTLSVSLSADPSSGPAPLNNVDLTAVVSGTATGPITYKFDCTADGSWEKIITTNYTTFTAVDLCDYPNPGSYTAKVKVERENLSFEGTTGIFVQLPPSLSVSLSADPSSGIAPLLDVDLTAVVSGTATGPITYRFDCTDNGTWEKVVTTSATTFTAVDLCDYLTPGPYTARVKVERQMLSVATTAGIYVQSPPTVTVNLTANPSSGIAPLNNVDLTATVGGTATGLITYRFDCTSDGVWDFTIATYANPYTAVNLCDYPNPGTYTAKVRVERQAVTDEDTTTITVTAPATLYVTGSAIPSSGHAPLNDVDIRAEVSGTATGSITYKFDCTADGIFERVHTTNFTTYTAYNLCDYSSPGVYTVKIVVERQGLIVQGTINVIVDTVATLAVDFSAQPNTGSAPLNNVDLVVFVSGTATGNIIYRFDCTSDGIWDHTITTSDTSYTALDLCDYPNPGDYKAKTRVKREGIEVEGTTFILVY